LYKEEKINIKRNQNGIGGSSVKHLKAKRIKEYFICSLTLRKVTQVNDTN